MMREEITNIIRTFKAVGPILWNAIKTGHFGAEMGPDGSVVKTAAAGAAIGAAFGGGSGAGKGAAVGAGLSLLTGSRHIGIPAGAMFEVTLLEDVMLK
jgi:hypothetical protein